MSAGRYTPTAKVTAATAAAAVVEFAVGMVEWLAAVDVPTAVEGPAVVLAVFGAGWLTRDRTSPAPAPPAP